MHGRDSCSPSHLTLGELGGVVGGVVEEDELVDPEAVLLPVFVKQNQ